MKNFPINIKNISYILISFLFIFLLGCIYRYVYIAINTKDISLKEINGFDLKYDLYSVFEEIDENTKIHYNIDSEEIIIKNEMFMKKLISEIEEQSLIKLGWEKDIHNSCFYKQSDFANSPTSLCLSQEKDRRVYTIN